MSSAVSRQGVQNRIGGFFFIIMNLVFGNLAMVPVFVEDRRQFVQVIIAQ